MAATQEDLFAPDIPAPPEGVCMLAHLLSAWASLKEQGGSRWWTVRRFKASLMGCVFDWSVSKEDMALCTRITAREVMGDSSTVFPNGIMRWVAHALSLPAAMSIRSGEFLPHSCVSWRIKGLLPDKATLVFQGLGKDGPCCELRGPALLREAARLGTMCCRGVTPYQDDIGIFLDGIVDAAPQSMAEWLGKAREGSPLAKAVDFAFAQAAIADEALAAWARKAASP